MELYSNSLTLRHVTLYDLKAVHELHSLPETDEFNTLGIPKDLEETKTILNNWELNLDKQPIENHTFIIENKNDKKFVGLIAINLGDKKFRRAEIWYKLHLSIWGKGYATEAVKRIIEFGFNELNLHRIEAGCAVDNIGSIKVLEKAGMRREGRKRKVLPLKNGWSDNFIYAILKEDT